MDNFVRAEALEENNTKGKKENQRGLLKTLIVFLVTLVICFKTFSAANNGTPATAPNIVTLSEDTTIPAVILVETTAASTTGTA